MSYEQVVNKGFLYINNLKITNNATTPNTKLDVSAGKCRDSSDVFDMELEDAVTINFAVNGANGLDTGSIGASKWYYIYLISSPISGNDTAAMASLSATPLMPAGYEAYRHIGWARSGGGSTLLKFNCAGNGNYRYHQWDTIIQCLNNGSATALTAVSLDDAVPPVEPTPVMLDIEFTPATADDYVSIANATSVATTLPSISGVVAAKKQRAPLRVMATLASSVAKIQYINSAASGNTDIYVVGFEYFI